MILPLLFPKTPSCNFLFPYFRKRYILLMQILVTRTHAGNRNFTIGMRVQCGAFAKTKGQRCNNRALPGSGYCILHLEKAPLIIGASIGAVLSLVVSITWNKIVPSDEQRELRELTRYRKSRIEEQESKRTLQRKKGGEKRTQLAPTKP